MSCKSNGRLACSAWQDANEPRLLPIPSWLEVHRCKAFAAASDVPRTRRFSFSNFREQLGRETSAFDTPARKEMAPCLHSKRQVYQPNLKATDFIESRLQGTRILDTDLTCSQAARIMHYIRDAILFACTDMCQSC